MLIEIKITDDEPFQVYLCSFINWWRIKKNPQIRLSSSKGQHSLKMILDLQSSGQPKQMFGLTCEEKEEEAKERH